MPIRAPRAVKGAMHRLLKIAGYEVRTRTVESLGLELYQQFGEEALRHRRFYNIGAGSFYHPYWTNIDYENDWYMENSAVTRKGIQHDLFSMEAIPVDTNSAEVAYTSHTIEHVTDEAVARLFSEVYRFLRPGGYFRIVAPDARLALDAYLRGDRSFFTWIEDYSEPERMKKMALTSKHNEASLEQVLLYHICSAVSELHADSPCRKIGDSEVRELIRQGDHAFVFNRFVSGMCLEVQRKYVGNHCNWWTHEKTAHYLRQAGFNEIYRSGYLQSRVPVLRNSSFFDNTVPSVSYFTECRKSAS